MKKNIIILSVLGLIFTSCITIKADGNSVHTDANFSLNQELIGEWKIVEINTKKENLGTFSFLNNENKVSINVGCNAIVSSYQLESKQKINFSEAMVSMKYCSENIHKKELEVGELLPKIIRYQFVGENAVRLETESENNYLIITK
ncbi:MAG: META domain-containing protein [Flavobacteriales bacterium]|nr:META domain-containing protein [Flavobacteriales bacterium]